jgi:hypothetical protein
MSAENVFRAWLTHGLSGCKFAAHLAAPKGDALAFITPSVDDIGDLAETIDGASDNGFVSILLFPFMRTEHDLVHILARLNEHPRWRVERHAMSRNDAVALSVTFSTLGGHESRAMGFGPVAQMPVTRRGPYFALALWAGKRINPYFDGGKPGTVNMAHAPHQLTQQKHEEMWAKTEAATAMFLTEPADDSVWLRKVAFCLPAASVPAELF